MHVEQKEIILGVLGASVSIAGLLLVFCGFLFGQAAIFPPTTPDAIIERFRRGGRIGIAPFLGSLAVATCSFTWLLFGQSWMYWVAVDGFALVLVATAVYGGVTICLL